MATLHVKMNQTRTIVNALLASFAVRGEHASWQQLCAMEKTTALTEMTKIIAVSSLFLIGVYGLGDILMRHRKFCQAKRETYWSGGVVT